MLNLTISEILNQYPKTDIERILGNHILELINDFSVLKERITDYSPIISGLSCLEVEIESIPFRLLADSDLGVMGKKNIENIEKDFTLVMNGVKSNIKEWEKIKSDFSDLEATINK